VRIVCGLKVIAKFVRATPFELVGDREPRTPPLTELGASSGKIGEEYLLLSTDDIYAFQAEVDLVWIVTAKRKSSTLSMSQHRHELRARLFFCRHLIQLRLASGCATPVVPVW
jgi:hypothetical protein